MAEGATIDAVHHLTVHGTGHEGRDGHHFQATKWDGGQPKLSGEATAARFQAEELDSLALTELTRDASLLTAWLDARVVNALVSLAFLPRA